MNDNLQHIYESIEPDSSCSRLEPYRQVILRWRRTGHSYRRILRALSANGVKVAIGTLHEFVQRRSRPRADEPPPSPPARSNQAEAKSMGVKEETRLPRRRSPEEIAAMRAASQRNQP